jgi:hypothetical protein
MGRTGVMLSAATIVVLAMVMASVIPAGDTPEQLFQRRIAAYLALHAHAEQPLPPRRVSSDPGDVHATVEAMAKAVRAARPDAKTGDIFTPEIAADFRRRLDYGIRAGKYNVADLLAAIADENLDGYEGIDITPVVNEPLRCGFAMTPPFVFEVLPPLSGEVEYRFVGRDLVLFDTHAALVVDVLGDALPAN